MTESSDYYDKESSVYSEKRYSGVTDTYVKFFFRKRKEIVLSLLTKVIASRTNLSLLDIACADGIMTKAVDDTFPGVFLKLVGTDLSLPMIGVAQKKFSDNKKFSFYVKDECPKDEFDIVLGLGYLFPPIFHGEMDFALPRIKLDGYYLCTLASSKSLFARIKLTDKSYYKDYQTYAEYKKMLGQYFEIIQEVPYGLFIPKLWAVPAMARIVQPVLEYIFKYILPNLFHEKIYLLKKKQEGNF